MDFVKRNYKNSIPRTMKHGDLVIFYERHNSLDHFFLHSGKTLNNKYGTFLHDDIIDKPFGSKIVSRKGSGWFYALEPNPEIWCNALNVRSRLLTT
jgi:tRNA (adenine57-N1/adenine58-N1)-methyltransferase